MDGRASLSSRGCGDAARGAHVVAVGVFTILLAGCDSAASVYVYSKPGASLEQMTRDETECTGNSGRGQSSPAAVRRCMTDRGYVAQELRQGSSYLEIRGMQTPQQNP